MNSRASKNLAMSGGKSIARLIVGGLKKVKDTYTRNHKAKQDLINKKGRYVIGS